MSDGDPFRDFKMSLDDVAKAQARIRAARIEKGLMVKDRVVDGWTFYEVPRWRDHPINRLRIWWIRRKWRQSDMKYASQVDAALTRDMRTKGGTDEDHR